jgi:hypothetical protein
MVHRGDKYNEASLYRTVADGLVAAEWPVIHYEVARGTPKLSRPFS